MGADCPRLRRLFSMSDGALPSQAMKFGAKKTVTFWILRRVAGVMGRSSIGVANFWRIAYSPALTSYHFASHERTCGS